MRNFDLKSGYFYYENGYVLENDLSQATTWKEIYINRLFANLDTLRKRVGQERRVLIPVKANAYGHGMQGIAHAVQARYYHEPSKKTCQDGQVWLGVANLMEAITLRKKEIQIPILVLGPAIADHMGYYHEYNIKATVASASDLKAWYKKEKAQSIAPAFHLKFDTGMGRLGVPMNELDAVCQVLAENVDYWPEGVYSHLATADEPNDENTLQQVQNFLQIQRQFSKYNLAVNLWHLANSGGVLNYPDSFFDMVRPGLSLYGYYPSESAKKIMQMDGLSLSPVMEVKSRVVSQKTLEPGHGVSYGRKFVTHKKTQMCVLPIGYGDGFPRSLSNRWSVLFSGDFFPVRGTVSMDQIVVQTHDQGPQMGDVVTIMGEDGNQFLWADDWARVLDTIPYEVLCRFSARVPMIYRQ